MVEYGHDEKPVFLGHYWMEGEPSPLADNIACLDYGVANRGGKLVAYRWNDDGHRTVTAVFVCSALKLLREIYSYLFCISIRSFIF